MQGSRPGSPKPAAPLASDSLPDDQPDMSAEEHAVRSLVANVLNRVTSHLDGPAAHASLQEPVVHALEEPAQRELGPQHPSTLEAHPEIAGVLPR